MVEKPSLFQDLPEQVAPVSISMAGVDPVWTEHKAKLIARYLRYFVFITKHGAYIDGFASPKSPDTPETWSAELVLKSEPKFLKQFYLCDLPDRVDYLHTLVERQEFSPTRKYRVYEGDFNQRVKDILESGEITGKTATFCLLDQFSCECHWQSLETLANHKRDGENKIELFYFLATGWLGRALRGFTRNMDVPLRWWGRPDWESLIGKSGDVIAIRMAERFRDELGYRFVHPWPIHERDKGQGRVMFHMIHASDHPEAPKLMKRAYRNVLAVPEPEEQLAMEFEGHRSN